MSTQLTKIPDDMRNAITKMESQFRLVLPKHVPPERFTRVLFTCVQRNPKLIECTRESIFASMMTAAENGLLPDGRQGALVPFRAKGGRLLSQFIPMWQGLLDLARHSGLIADAYVASVRENDEFEYELGLDRKLVHKPVLRNRGDIVMVYAVVVFKDGTKTFGPGPMTVEEVEEIRSVSKAKDSGPWVDWWEQMAHKTVLKRVLKFVPQSPELTTAIETDNEAEVVQLDVATPAEKSTTASTTAGDNVEDIRRRIAESQASERVNPPGVPWQGDNGHWWVTTTAGEEQQWDERVHSSGRDDQGRPHVNQDGSFRKRRVVARPEPTSAPKPSPGPSDDDMPPAPPLEGSLNPPGESQSPEITVDALLVHLQAAATLERVDELQDMARSINKSSAEGNQIADAVASARLRLEG